jgi:AcrR family transcriptional regulator
MAPPSNFMRHPCMLEGYGSRAGGRCQQSNARTCSANSASSAPPTGLHVPDRWSLLPHLGERWCTIKGVSPEPPAATRPYQMRKRLEDVDETRRRIVEAAVELHGTVGPVNTTISGVAARAGVQRSTVYRHFPDDEALFGACTSHWFARHPWPRADELRSVADAGLRLRRGLRDLYGYYDENEQMLSNAMRDIEIAPPFVGEHLRAQLEGTHAVLVEAWPPEDRPCLRIAIRHAIDLRTWLSLRSQGLRPTQAAELMSAMVRCLTPSAG